MTPTIDTPEVSSGDLSVFEEIGEVLNGAGGEEQPTEQAEQPIDAAATDTLPPGEAPTQPEQIPGQSPTPPGEGPTYKLSEDGNSYLVPKNELAPLTGYKKYAEEVQGWFPTAADAQAAYQHFSYDQQMRSDYLHGADTDLDAFVQHWAGADYYQNPQMQRQYQERFAQMAQRMPEILKGINENAYYSLAEGLVSKHIERAYELAAQTGSPADLEAAQRYDWGWTGKYKTELPKADPNKPVLEQQQAREREITQRETAALSRDWKSFNDSTVEGPKWQQYNAELDKTLEPVKNKYDPIEFGAIRDKISTDLIAKLNADQEFSRIHKSQQKAIESGYANAWKRQAPADELKPLIQARHNHLMTQVRRLLPSIAAPLLKAATTRKVSQSPANRQPQSTPATRPNQPAAPGQQPARRGAYDIHDDPQWTGMFRAPQ